ncbi:MAG TPA: aldo/keto reductase [Nocardioides sp.]|jgi:aryl-alcohol dehydrogenase-like predicted oxidoreductase|uniref:aldo/keto reductase n=1 Tax=Nocardioides sp. TaxID=35761 RepID=UPI002E31461E|nr:aldo/keto reductase [Nocardioides sp.]HEX3932745.1 aldo/keto reductase [Nocardioides sp.]
MAYRPLGDSGLMVSAVGIGCNAFGNRIGLDAVRGILDAAEDEGVTLLDTSDSYSLGQSEELIGVAMEGRRDRFVVATKFGSDMRGSNGPDYGARGARRYVRRAVDASLARLRTDRIDLYQLHFPDPVTPIAETLSALTDLVREGKVCYLGCSNLSGWQIADADWTARSSGFERFVSAQNSYSLLDRSVEADVVPAAERFGLGLLPYFPLERGLLTGKYRRGEAAPEGSRATSGPSPWLDDADWDRIEALASYADERGVSMLDVAIAGLAAQPTVASVISGATSGDQVRTNAAALRWQPTADDLVRLDEITRS